MDKGQRKGEMETHCKALLGHVGGGVDTWVVLKGRIFPDFTFKEFFARYGHMVILRWM